MSFKFDAIRIAINQFVAIILHFVIHKSHLHAFRDYKILFLCLQCVRWLKTEGIANG